nr:uncharacterized protein LOC115254822 [Aedes albopictus]
MDKGKYVRPTERAEEDDNGMNSTTETQAEGTNPGLGTVEHDETTDTTNKGNGSASTEPENTSSESSDSESSDTESSDSDAATRDEAYEAETSQSPDSHVFHVERQTSSNNYRKRRNPDESIRGPYAKRRQIDQGQGRRSRCSRCNLTSHRTGKCPAIDKKCINCGKVGHFAAACRGKRVNAIRFKRENTPDDDQDDERDVEKQVLKN